MKSLRIERIQRRGFTLIELMLVVAIIGLLSAIAVPKFGDMIDASREAGLKGYLGNIRYAERMYYIDNEGVSAPHLASGWGDPNFGLYRYIDQSDVYPTIPALPRSIKSGHAFPAYYTSQNVSFFFPMVVADNPSLSYYYNTDSRIGRVIFCLHAHRSKRDGVEQGLNP